MAHETTMSRLSTKDPPFKGDTVFGIHKSELIPIVENATQAGPIVNIEIEVEDSMPAVEGTESESVIATFSYQTETGTRGIIPMFVKHFLHTDWGEADNYLAVAQVDIPTPRFYGYRFGSKGEEILFLELLASTQIDLHSEAEVLEWIRLVAQINTTPLPFAHFKIPEPQPNNPMIPNPQWVSTVHTIWEKGLKGELGIDVQSLCCENPQGSEVLTDYARHLGRLRKLKNLQRTALVNGDFAIQNFGWRITESGKEIVAFDLTDLQVDYRFCDISRIMGGEVSNCVFSDKELGIHYLTVYNELSNSRMTQDEFFEEVTLLSDSGKYVRLAHLLKSSLEDKGSDTNKDKYSLHRIVKELLESHE